MYTYNARVERVIDGDTVDAIVDLGFDVQYKVRFRLDGINTPEKTGSTKRAGLDARDFLRDIIEGKDVQIESTKKEKYGRYLAVIYFENMNINDLMIETGHAQEYHGGKR